MWNGGMWNGFMWNGPTGLLAVPPLPPPAPEPVAGLFTAFLFGETLWRPSLPARAWVPARETVGGRSISSAGVAAAYLVRTHRLLVMTLRFEESEWEMFRAFIRTGQTQIPFTWYPDADDPDSGRLVYLHSPTLGEPWSPSRMAGYPRAFERSITLRAVGNDDLFVRYFA